MSTQTTIPTDRLDRLNRHHEITETYIGIARLRLENGDAAGAKRALDTCCDKLDELLPPAVRKLYGGNGEQS